MRTSSTPKILRVHNTRKVCTKSNTYLNGEQYIKMEMVKSLSFGMMFG
jgi:hypothetical protein